MSDLERKRSYWSNLIGRRLCRGGQDQASKKGKARESQNKTACTIFNMFFILLKMQTLSCLLCWCRVANTTLPSYIPQAQDDVLTTDKVR